MSKDFWDGRYETSREGQQSLEQDIIDAMGGKYTSELPGGGTIRQTDHSINVYYPDSNSPDGHGHEGVNDKGEYYKKPQI